LANYYGSGEEMGACASSRTVPATQVADSQTIVDKLFDTFRATILDLIALCNERLETMLEADLEVVADLEDLEANYGELLDKTSPAEQEAIGEFWREALGAYGSTEEVFAQYPDASGLLYWLRFEAGRQQLMDGLRLATRPKK